MHEQRSSRHSRQFAPHLADDLVGCQLPFFPARLQRDKHTALILGRISAGKRNHGLHILVSHDDVHKLLHFFSHRRKRDILVSLH